MTFKPCPWSLLMGVFAACLVGLVVFSQSEQMEPLVKAWAAGKAPPKPPELAQIKEAVGRLEAIEKSRAEAKPTPSPEYQKIMASLMRIEASEAKRLALASAANAAKAKAAPGRPIAVQLAGGAPATSAPAKPQSTSAFATGPRTSPLAAPMRQAPQSKPVSQGAK